MGVAGAAGVLDKQGSRFSSHTELKDTKLVVDVTESMYWFVKKHYPARSTRPDLYGSSMVALCAFYRDFFKRLRERNVTPIVVYSGGRLSEAHYGPVASKSNHLQRSSRNALTHMNYGRFSNLESMPQLAQQGLKEVINEFQLEHVYQSVYEVYPLLERLAREHNCPVITSHSDFMFTPTPQGFIWFDSLELPSDSQQPMRARLYSHQQMLDHFGRQNEAQAIKALYALLRDDFAQLHHQAMNKLLNLQGELAFSRNPKRVKTRRLLHILQHWPSNLTSMAKIHEQLNRMGGRPVSVDRDFRAILESYSHDQDLRLSDLAKAFVPADVNDFGLACTRRESVATYMMELRQSTTYNRCQTVEDLRTIRSTYSLGDRAKQYLLHQLSVEQLQVFDRRQATYNGRQLRAMAIKPPADGHQNSGHTEQQPRRMDCAYLYHLFHFDSRTLNEVGSKLSRQLHISDQDDAKCLALLLLLARFGYKLAFRQTYDNEDTSAAKKPANVANNEPQPGSDQSASLSSGTETDSSSYSDQNYKTPEMRQCFYSAIVNSYVFHMANSRRGDTVRQEIPADLRVACDKMRDVQTNVNCPGLGEPRYFQVKHLIEMLNVVLQNYKELNSLYGYVAPNFLVNRHYDGLLMYNLMYKWSNRLSEYLLKVEGDLLEQLTE